MAVLRNVVAFLLILQAAITSVWVAGHLSGLGGYDAIVIVAFVARAMVGALQLMSGWWLLDNRSIAFTLARVALVSSALLTTIELGWRIASTNLDHAWRTPAIIGEWIYAAIALWFLRRRDSSPSKNRR